MTSTTRYKRYYLIIPTVIILLLKCNFCISEELIDDENTTAITSDQVTETEFISINNQSPAGRSLFSPQIDYNNKWMPVGRGDPLKNDPTYDYSPPVLDRVHYWGEGANEKNKKEILILGVSSKRAINRKMDTLPSNAGNNRRNYFIHQLPTVLMPPPMPILHQSQSNDNTKQLIHQTSAYPLGNVWPSKINVHSDAVAESSNNFVSIAHPNRGSQHKEVYDPYKTYTAYSQKPVQKKPWIHELLQREVTKPTTTLTTTTAYTNKEHQYKYQSHYSDIETTTHFEPTISPITITSTSSSITNNDELFPQYKKPTKSNPEHNMYLIIQGHSKVKTYGQPDDNNGKPLAKIVPIENNENPVIKHVVSQDDKGVKLEVKHLHKSIKSSDGNKNKDDGKNIIEDNSKNGMGSLLSLLDTTFGDYFRADDDHVKKQNLISMKNNTDKLNELELSNQTNKTKDDNNKHVMKLIRNKVE